MALLENGEQTDICVRYDLIPHAGICAIAKTMHEGSKNYSPGNWRKINTESHLNHALNHIFLALKGDTEEPHLEHAITRLALAIETRRNWRKNEDH